MLTPSTTTHWPYNRWRLFSGRKVNRIPMNEWMTDCLPGWLPMYHWMTSWWMNEWKWHRRLHPATHSKHPSSCLKLSSSSLRIFYHWLWMIRQKISALGFIFQLSLLTLLASRSHSSPTSLVIQNIHEVRLKTSSSSSTAPKLLPIGISLHIHPLPVQNHRYDNGTPPYLCRLWS